MGTNEHICPLCMLEELSQIESPTGEKATVVIEAYNQLCEAEEGFYESLNEKLEEYHEESKGAIQSLDLSEQNMVKAKVRNVENGLHKQQKQQKEQEEEGEGSKEADMNYVSNDDNLPF